MNSLRRFGLGTVQVCVIDRRWRKKLLNIFKLMLKARCDNYFYR